ncbi:hypothetical protein MCAV_06490 [[Mycoplasma] cavipharyngis]|uniref:hypothetical protein n=1 Tax=[Mycoplasma] cavipharyngis TaxID=92757 RepID=UPI003703C9CA
MAIFKKKKKFLKSSLILLGLGIFNIPILSACVSPTQDVAKYSTRVKNRPETYKFKAAQHTPNYYKPPRLASPIEIDSKYTGIFPNFDQDPNSASNSDVNSVEFVLDPSLIPEGRIYQQTIANLTKDDIKNDLLDSLIEIIENNPNVYLDFNKLELDFRLIKQSSSRLLINSFLMKLVFSNNGINAFNLFNSISIPGQSTVELTINLFEGTIRPDYSVGSDRNGLPGSYAASWAIEANAFDFTVNTKYIAGALSGNETSFNPKRINFITSRSFAINTFYAGFSSVTTYEILKQTANYDLAKLDSETIKKDINDWWTQYFRLQASLGYQDVERIMNYLIAPSIKDSDGILRTPLYILLVDKNKREEILKIALHNPGLRNIINSVLDQKIFNFNGSDKDKQQKAAQEYVDNVTNFFKYLLNLNLSTFFDQGIEVRVEWIKDPVLYTTNINDPHISFQYRVKVTFKENLKIDSKAKFINQDNKEYQYDIASFLQLDKIIIGLSRESNNKKNNTSQTDALLNSFAKLFALDKLEVKKGESITFGFEATQSPLTLAVSQTLDVAKAENVNLGWEATDTKLTVDLSKMQTFWEIIYHKMNLITYKGGNTGGLINAFKGIGEIKALADRVKKGEYDILFQILDYLFVSDAQRQLVNHPRNKREARPVEVLFDTITNQEYSVASYPMRINLSRAFYYLADQFNSKPLWVATNNTNADFAKNTIINNPDLSLTDLVPTLGFNIENTLGNNNTNYDNQTNFALLWKKQQFLDQTNSFSYQGISAKTSIYKYEAAAEQIKAILSKVKTDEQLYQSQPQILDIVKKNFINHTNYQFNPKVSITKIPLDQAIRSVFHKRVQAGIGGLAHFVNFFDSSKYDINSAADHIVDLNPHIINVNLQIPDFILGENSSGIYTTKVSEVTTWFVAPIVDPNKIKID